MTDELDAVMARIAEALQEPEPVQWDRIEKCWYWCRKLGKAISREHDGWWVWVSSETVPAGPHKTLKLAKQAAEEK